MPNHTEKSVVNCERGPDDMEAPTSPYFHMTQVEPDGLVWIEGAIPLDIAQMMLEELNKRS